MLPPREKPCWHVGWACSTPTSRWIYGKGKPSSSRSEEGSREKVVESVRPERKSLFGCLSACLVLPSL